MKCSFIVSCYNRPLALPCLLYSLRLQTETGFEVIVTDNAVDDEMADKHEKAVLAMNDDRFRYFHPKCLECYASANWGAKFAEGDYLSFPCDDGYYAPRFLEHMLTQTSDLIFCNFICGAEAYSQAFGSGPNQDYPAIKVGANYGLRNKGGFLIRRSKFPGFPTPDTARAFCGDGFMLDAALRAGCSWNKVDGYMWVQN